MSIIYAGEMVKFVGQDKVAAINKTTNRCKKCKKFAKFIYRNGYGEKTSKCCNAEPLMTFNTKMENIVGIAVSNSDDSGQIDVIIQSITTLMPRGAMCKFYS